MWNLESWGNSYNPKDYEASYEFYKGKRSQSNSNGSSQNLGGSRSRCVDSACSTRTGYGPTDCKKFFMPIEADCWDVGSKCEPCKWDGTCIGSKKYGTINSDENCVWNQKGPTAPSSTATPCTSERSCTTDCKKKNPAHCNQYYQLDGKTGSRAYLCKKTDHKQQCKAEDEYCIHTAPNPCVPPPSPPTT